jgi:hypothetical protein
MLRILLVILLLLVNCLPVFAMPYGTTFQVKNYSVIVPYAAIGIPVGDQNGIELGGTSLGGGTYALAAVFSKQINSSENERSLMNLGALYMHFPPSVGGGWFTPSFPEISIIFPVIEFEQERLISKGFSWLLNFGYPSLIGFGLKWYL